MEGKFIIPFGLILLLLGIACILSRDIEGLTIGIFGIISGTAVLVDYNNKKNNEKY